MPAYNTVPAIGIYYGDTQNVWSAETPSTSTASQQVALPPNPDGGIYSISAEIQFSGAPGTFEVDLQTADTDTDHAYVTVPGYGVINQVNANNWTRAEVSVKAKFARLYLSARGNSVSMTASISR